MKSLSKFDLSYVTNDSLVEGVGSSQITPLIRILSSEGLRIRLVSCEKDTPDPFLLENFTRIGVDWKPIPFGSRSESAAIKRILQISTNIGQTRMVHARSDVPAIAAAMGTRAPVLWDVRSLWADQKIPHRSNWLDQSKYGALRSFEFMAALQSSAMSTLTHAVVPILESRNLKIPSIRTVVPTAVDLNHFQFNPNFPKPIRALFSGTYNDYYDLNLSANFLRVLSRHITLTTDWARPSESTTKSLDVGEILRFKSTYKEMPFTISDYSFGVSVCKMNMGDSLKGAVPTKIAEFLSVGRPVVVNKGLGDMDMLLQKYRCGIILDGTQENLEQSALELISMLNDPETPYRCRELAEEHFDLQKGAKNYLQIYQNWLG
ncbi:GT4_WbuB-like domain containing protein [Candidatus Nanopelagicaceae bacterium]